VKFLSDDSGNATLEAVSFVAMSFGLILLSAIQLFSVQIDQLELSLVSRNVMSSYLSDSDMTLGNELSFWKSRSSLFDQDIALKVNCTPDCTSTGSIVVADFSFQSLSVRVFGVLSD